MLSLVSAFSLTLFIRKLVSAVAAFAVLSLPCWGADQTAPAPAAPDQSADPSAVTKSANQAQPGASQSPGASAPTKPAAASAVIEKDYWIDPDRPHIADSSVNVPKGLWLQENGFQQSFPNGRSRIFDVPESLIRLGVSDRTELRYNLPNFVTSSTLIPDQSILRQSFTGFENMQAGFKQRLGPIGGSEFQLAVNPFISIPSHFGGPNSSRVDPNIKFPFSQEINEKWDIEGMQSFFDPTINGHRNLDWQSSLVLNRSWGRQRNAFIEYVGDVFQKGPMSNIIHFGAAYRPGRRQQMDVQFGFRLNDAAPIAFFGFGYSFLLGNLNTPRLTPSRFKH